ncbi:hypothetical protein HTS61_11380 [Escherichia coli]|nr:hypothetical protein [Escherichia coli]
MSAITVSRPEVVNGHTDVICSTSIRHILAVRKSTLLQIDTLIRQLAEISAMTESIGGKTARDWAMKQDFSLRLLADGENGNRNESYHPQP